MIDLLELYQKEIEVVSGTMGIYKGDKIVNKNPNINAENKEFIKNHMQKIFAGNLNTDILNEAIDNLLPYLFEK